MYRLSLVWTALRASFWFLPYVIVTVFIAAAVVLTHLQPDVARAWRHVFPDLFDVGSNGARDMLSTIASSMMSVVGIVFSMTLVALTLASSQYSSRVLRTFMRSRVTQISIGVFAGLYVYCLIVLRGIRGDGDELVVPVGAVALAMLAAAGAVALLIFFIHHIAISIQAASVLANIARETVETIETMYPAPCADEEPREQEPAAAGGQLVCARRSGYIQSIDEAALLALAGKHGVRIDLLRGVGQFVIRDTAVMRLSGGPRLGPDDERALCRTVSLSDERTVAQDPAFGIRQIVDVALRALSPGVNDTTTAVMALDNLGTILAAMGPRGFPSRYQCDGQAVRLVTVQPDYPMLVGEAFDQIRRSADGNVAVLLRIAGTIELIGTLKLPAQRYRPLVEQLDYLAEANERTVPAAFDRDTVRERIAQARACLAAELAQGS
ncbi:DUF2254 domain-containing protein [Massilia sp. PAMC28688]|uniref:DUF2254 domain-containing protein n=1 Tax=Massilia sp. PAMC28688 TaxID=2861283 RepID=UPI001C62B04E|nr:DUF2254 domain-containing protein [Massilia sp. PAMC28688]QYF95407.1 DUF2254 domain-containing protein [Massilia sp. PAMC28688]